MLDIFGSFSITFHSFNMYSFNRHDMMKNHFPITNDFLIENHQLDFVTTIHNLLNVTRGYILVKKRTIKYTQCLRARAKFN